MPLGTRLPLDLYGADVAEQIRQVVRPSGHLNLALLQEIRAVIPIERPGVPIYWETFFGTAVVGEVQVLQLRATGSQTVYPLWIEPFASPAAAFQLEVMVGQQPAVAPVFTNAQAASFERTDQIGARQTIGSFGSFPSAGLTGQVVYNRFILSTATEGPPRISLTPWKIRAGQQMNIRTNAPNQACRFTVAVAIELGP